MRYRFRVELVENKRKAWFWRLRSAINKRIMAYSEEYSKKVMANKTASVIRDKLRGCDPKILVIKNEQ